MSTSSSEDRAKIIEGIPRGQASERLIPGCLVLEGGAFRGLYTQGFLDAMMEQGLNLSCVVGVSAGALAGVNYVSGQIGRSAGRPTPWPRPTSVSGCPAPAGSTRPIPPSASS